MEVLHTNWIDIGFILFILIFGIFGFLSGFTDKFLSSIAWVSASLLTMHTYPFLKPWVATHISNPTIATAVTFGAIFLVLIITFKMGVSYVATFIKDSPLGGLDRGLGILLGIITGIIFLALLTLAMRFVVKNSEYPAELKQSKIWVFSTAIGTYIEKILPLKVPPAPTSFNASKVASDLSLDKSPLWEAKQSATYTKADRQKIKRLT